MFYVLLTLHSKRFQSSYCAKVKTGAKTPRLSFLFFALVSTFLTNSRGNACYAGCLTVLFNNTARGQGDCILHAQKIVLFKLFCPE